MKQVNMHEAKTRLSKLVEEIVSGQEDQIIIARNGTPAARLTAVGYQSDVSHRIGVARGKFSAPDPSEQLDSHIIELFTAESSEHRSNE